MRIQSDGQLQFAVLSPAGSHVQNRHNGRLLDVVELAHRHKFDRHFHVPSCSATEQSLSSGHTAAAIIPAALPQERTIYAAIGTLKPAFLS